MQIRYRSPVVNAALVAMVVLVGCASENVDHTQSAPPIYQTLSTPQTANRSGLGVLVGSSARIEGRDLVWSCAYQTAEGRVLLEQPKECEQQRWLGQQP